MGDETIDRVLYTAIIAYVLTMSIIIIVKPRVMYDDEQKKFKTFGTKENETILAMPIVGITMCIVVYLIVVMYSFIIKKLQ